MATFAASVPPEPSPPTPTRARSSGRSVRTPPRLELPSSPEPPSPELPPPEASSAASASVLVLGCAPVVHRGDRDTRACAEPSAEGIVRLHAPQHPVAVAVEEPWQRGGFRRVTRRRWVVDADRHAIGRAVSGTR
eukprot:scaffold22146_cov69-Phaeocystis_antarctica.AAC.5